MTIRRTSRVLAVLVCLALWPVHTSAQQGAWERHMRAGEAAYQQGDYAEAVNQTKASLKAAEAFGSDDPRLATSLNNLAVICEAQGWYGEAEPLFQRSLVTREMAFGPEHLDVAASLNNLASLYRAQGKYAEAKPPPTSAPCGSWKRPWTGTSECGHEPRELRNLAASDRPRCGGETA